MKTAVKTAAALAIAVLAAGCSTTGVSGGAERVAFGSLTLISNGHEHALGDRLVDRHAVIEVRSKRDQRLYSGRVGQQGRFALSLPAGEYVLETIGFEHHDEMIEAPANFRFTVSNEYRSVYIGAVTLEATLDTGIYGVVGTADRYTVSNECSSDCDEELDAFGLQAATAGISLMSWDHQMAAATSSQ